MSLITFSVVLTLKLHKAILLSYDLSGKLADLLRGRPRDNKQPHSLSLTLSGVLTLKLLTTLLSLFDIIGELAIHAETQEETAYRQAQDRCITLNQDPNLWKASQLGQRAGERR